MKRLLAALGLILCAQLAFGQHPNDARGFEAGKVYNFNDVDTVGSFNGNLMVHLPIGPPYRVNGALSYQLGLSYNSHCWRFSPNDSDETGTVTKAYPIGSFNAGFGWTLSLGRLFYGGDPEITGATASWTYQSSDGADHNFYSTLHNGVGTVVADVYYTHDGSYVRLSKVAAQEVVELGDGTKNEFTQIDRTTNPWSPSTTSKDWVLTGIADQFGNRVNIAYTRTMSFAEIWTITDGARTTSVYFKTSATPSQSPPPSPANVVLDHIDTQMTGGALATYGFTTQVLDVPLPNTDTSNRQNRISITVLTAVTPPAGNPYRMTLNTAPAYDTTWVTNGVGAIRGQTPGVLTRLVLPTLGSIGWTHQTVQFTLGSHDPMRSPAVERPVGVVARTTYDASGQLLGTWTYGRRFSSVPNPCLPTPFCLDGNGQPLPECPSGRSRQLTTWVTEPSIPGADTKTTINYFSNYESISTNPNGDTCDTSAEGWKHGEHGLPFTRYATRDGRYLSTEVRTGNIWDGSPWLDGRGMVPDGGTRVRATYVTYQLDNGPYDEQEPIEYNAVPASTATYFYDDTSNCGSSGTDPCYFTAVNNLAFDTYGHFRQTSTDGNLPGTGNSRTTFTNYNAAPATTAPWLLNTYSERCTVDEGSRRLSPVASCDNLPSALITKTQYDASGALTAHRILLNSGGTLATSDLLATFAHDAHGNLTSEQYYGGDGDTQVLGTDPSTPFATVNNASPPATIDPQYAITHALTYTSSALTREIGTYANSVTASDVTYDQSTGLVTDTRDVAGLTTHYNYDLLGRVTSVQPPGVTQTVYTYADAALAGSVFTPAKVSAVTDPSNSSLGKISKEYQYDPFGRLRRQKSLLRDDTWNIVQTDIDILGRKTAVSQPESLPADESSFVPSHKTIFSSYDPVGRARSIQAPDLSTTTFAFAGVRSVTRTESVATSAAGDTPVSTTEIHDALGRLYQLTERSGATSASSPVGTNTTTTYSYDFADHLTDVATSGSTQHRAFHYDNRGFLTQEQHPELGQSGNEFVYYGAYDARGHAANNGISQWSMASSLRL
jgi:YD repeat-containing protein